MDGRAQRRALTAAEQALRALGERDAGRAVRAAQRAGDLDQVGIYTGLPSAVAAAASAIERGEEVGGMAWDAVAAAVGLGPLSALVMSIRESA